MPIKYIDSNGQKVNDNFMDLALFYLMYGDYTKPNNCKNIALKSNGGIGIYKTDKHTLK